MQKEIFKYIFFDGDVTTCQYLPPSLVTISHQAEIKIMKILNHFLLRNPPLSLSDDYLFSKNEPKIHR